MRRSDWISVLVAVAIVLLYALFTRPVASPPLTRQVSDPPPTTSTTRPATSRIYDVRDLLDQGDAFSACIQDMLPAEKPGRWWHSLWSGFAWGSSGSNRARGGSRGGNVWFPIRGDFESTSAEDLMALLQTYGNQGDAQVGPLVDGRVCIVADEKTHWKLARLLDVLRRQGAETEEIKP